MRDDEQVPPEGGEFLVLHSTFFDLKIVDTTVNEEIQEVIRRANSYHERFGFEERKDLPHTQLGDLCILLIFLIARRFPLFEQIATNENVMGYLRNALDTAYLLGYQAGKETAEPPTVFANVFGER